MYSIMNKKYIKNGKVLPKNKIEINYNNKYYLNPPEDILLKDGWVEYNKINSNNLPPFRDINIIRNKIVKNLINYDKSSDVNSFYVNGAQVWIDRDTRVSLMNSTQILKNSGQENTVLWLNGKAFNINCDLLIQMLSSLEIYALQCYNVTEQHKTNILNLTTEDDVRNYNFKEGYPEKLTFNI